MDSKWLTLIANRKFAFVVFYVKYIMSCFMIMKTYSTKRHEKVILSSILNYTSGKIEN